MIRIAACGKSLCGFIAKAVIDPETGQPMKDKHNQDPAKRDRPLTGIQVLKDMRPAGPNTWSGTLYNDDDGGLYPGKIIELDAGSIRIEGCALGICGGDTLSRARP